MNPPLVAHIVHRFAVGGMENGMVNLINRMPAERYRHAVICLADHGDMARRIDRDDVVFYDLHKRPGKDLALYGRLKRLVERLAPDIVHTRNLSALEGQFVAAWCGVRARIHGEHGRDVFDLYGRNRRYNLLRRAARPLVRRYVAVSHDLARWLVETVGVPSSRVRQIYNGVDVERFRPRQGPRPPLGRAGFVRGDSLVVGSVGRMAEVKDYPTLVHAFAEAIRLAPSARERLRLVIVGEGVHRPVCQALAEALGVGDLVWLPGERDDVPALMQGFDLFVLPSLGEGISNTILEAMASGLPVIVTRVGGNPELVEAGVHGRLVPPGQPRLLAQALLEYLADPARLRRQGRAARERVCTCFSLDAMVRGYLDVYDEVLALSAA